MAGGGLYIASSKRQYNYSSRPTAFVLLTCITAATGGLIFGYDLGVSGGVTSMDDFLLKFFPEVYNKKRSAKTDNYCKFDSQLLTAFTSSLYLAGLFTAAFASNVSSRYGRRACIRIGGVCFIMGSVLNAAATNLAMLILGRVTLGIGLGFTNQSMPLYLSEMAPPRLRGGLNSMAQVNISIGAFTAFLVNYATAKIIPWGWRISLGLTMVPSIIILLGSVFLPDSPSSLIERGYLEESRAVLEKMRGTEDVGAEFEDLMQASQDCKAVKHPWRQIMERRYRPVLVMAVGIPFFQQVTGINIITFYAPLIFQSLGLGASASLYAAVILGGALVGGSILAVVVVDKVGRRALLLNGGLQMFATQVIIGAMLQLKLGVSDNKLSKVDVVVVVAMVCIFAAAFGWSWAPLGVLVPSEIFPLEVRAVGQSISACMVLGMICVEAQVFLAMLCRMHASLFFMFGAWAVGSIAFVWWFLPETKHVPIETMAHVWQQHPFWGRFTSIAPIPT